MRESELETRARLEANNLFSAAGAAVQGLRLRIEKKVVVSVDDLYSAFQEARRKFEDRKYREAYDKYDQVYNQFGERIGQWERKAEGHLKAVKESHKPGKLEQLKLEIADVKKQSQGAARLLSRLRSALEPLSKLEGAEEIDTAPAVSQPPQKRQPVRRARVLDESLLDFPDDEGMPSKPAAQVIPPRLSPQCGVPTLPSGFLEAFRAADRDRRPEIVRWHFDVECEPTVEVVQTGERRMSVAFDPPLETGRYWFLLGPARILRIDGTGKVLDIYDPEQDQSITMPLKDFVGLVQSGAWLLRPKPTFDP